VGFSSSCPVRWIASEPFIFCTLIYNLGTQIWCVCPFFQTSFCFAYMFVLPICRCRCTMVLDVSPIYLGCVLLLV
jgi:hypothetical protein